MFVEKPKEEVYDVVINERVLVLVSMDVDSLCACKILQWLFKCDNVQYTIVPVSGKEDLARAYHEHSEQLKHIFMVNCGANLNILEMLEPEDDVMFYIADSHRPIDLDNIYNQDQVKLLMKEGEELTVPDFDDIYADSEEEFEDSDEEGSEPSSKRRRTGDGVIRTTCSVAVGLFTFKTQIKKTMAPKQAGNSLSVLCLCLPWECSIFDNV